MKRQSIALLLAAVFLIGPAANVVTASSHDEVVPPNAPQLPEDREPKTGIIPVDRNVHEAVAETNQNVRAAYQVVGTTLNVADETAGGIAREPLTLYRDGMGGSASSDPHDGRDGGFGEWRIIGSTAWAIQPEAAARGEVGYGTSVLAGGGYPNRAASLLVSPEVDLRTNLLNSSRTRNAIVSACHAAGGATSPASNPTVPGNPGASTTAAGAGPFDCDLANQAQGAPDLSVSRVYNFLYWSCAGPVSFASGAEFVFLGSQSVGPLLNPACRAYQDLLNPQQAYVAFQYTQRHNLATGLDGVQVMVFTAAPTSIAQASDCAFAPLDAPLGGADPPFCRVAVPRSGYHEKGLPVFQGEKAYSGFGEWETDAIDLTPWEGRSVWVGFYFASTAIVNPAYFQNPSRFAQAAGFFGFQLDDVKVEAPAAPVNLRVRPLTQPAFTPPGFERPTLDPKGVVPVASNVTNFGSRTLDVFVVTRLLLASDRSVVAESASDRIHLPAGSYLRMHEEFAGLASGSYIAQICAYRGDEGPAGGDAKNCASSPSPPECGADLLLADPCSQVEERRFDLRPAQVITSGPIQRSADQIQIGDKITFAIPIQNRGNTPEVVRVQAHLVNVATGTFDGDEMIDPEQRQARLLEIGVGKTAIVKWEVQGKKSGQYRLFVQLGDARSFDPTFDPLPAVIHPWSSGPVPPAQEVKVDGLLDEWVLAVLQPIAHGPVRLQAMNNASFLFISLRNTTTNGIGLFLDDLADSRIGKTHDFGLLIEQAGTSTKATSLRFSSESSDWSPGPANPSVEAAVSNHRDGRGNVFPGRFDFELKIPIARSEAWSLGSRPGDKLGLLVRLCPSLSPTSKCDHAPLFAPLFDGDGFLPKDGLIDDEARQWGALRLSAGPFNQNADQSTVAYATYGPGIGIGVGPPPYLHEDFTQCQNLRGWAQDATRVPAGPARDKWNCGHFSDDGRSLLYKGLSPDSTCSESSCLPYSALPSLGRPTRFQYRVERDLWNETFGYVPDLKHLWSRPFEIPPDSVTPTLLLAHQYSTDIDIDDENLTPPAPGSAGRIKLHHRLNVSLEEWTSDGWIDRGPLDPLGGYSREKDLAIRGTQARHFYKDSNCPPSVLAGEPPGPYVPGFDWNFCGFSAVDSSWWWPQGEQPRYRDPTTQLPTASYFSGGSPWFTDVIPLYGSHFESEPLRLQGGTFRLRFLFHASDAVANHNRTLDWGWRIGGLTVLEGSTFGRDITVESATLDVPYDARRLGVGPGTTVPVRVAIRNVGLLDVQRVEVSVVGADLSEGRGLDRELCRTEGTELSGTLLAGQTRQLVVPCAIPESPGALLSLRASTKLGRDPEDFLGNNQQRVAGHFPVQAKKGASIRLDVTPRDAAANVERHVQILVENQGNVPLGNVEVRMRIMRLAGVELKDTGIGGSWRLEEALPANQAGLLLSGSTPTDPPIVEDRDFRVKLPGPGTYLVVSRVSAPGSVPPESEASVRIQASDLFYRNDFDGALVGDPAVVRGSLEVDPPWFRATGNGPDGSNHLAAGDPATGEIPPNTSAFIQLPTLDLSGVKRASLSFRHRYDLEQGFDAGRIELSTDGGNSWGPLIPRAQPLNGLPDGYPAVGLLGASPLQDRVETFAGVFSGRSEDLPADEDGWISSEVNLDRLPHLFTVTQLEDFRLDHPSRRADAVPYGPPQAPEFRNATWFMDEPDADGNLRYWWIDNLTYSTPQPLSGGKMWWSGSAGEKPLNAEMQPIDTTLSMTIDTAGIGIGEEERLILSFWDWRAGGSATADRDRSGTGGNFVVKVLPDGERPADYRVVDRLSSGWARRELDVTPLMGKNVGLAFHYKSGHADGQRLVKPVVVGGDGFSTWLPEIQDNRGWFIDGVELIKRAPFGDQVLGRRDARDASGWNVKHAAGTVEWRRVQSGPAGIDGGWHIESDVEVPRKGRTHAWEFSNHAGPEYPNNAESRLVTPLVDLRQADGKAFFHFDHRFQFQGSSELGGRAVDAGAVEYQVLDPITGTFGAWRTLGAKNSTQPVSFLSTDGFDAASGRTAFENARAAEVFSAFGYTSVAPAPEMRGLEGGEVRIRSGAKVTTGDADFGTYLTNFLSARIDWVDANGDMALQRDERVFLDVDGDGRVGGQDVELGLGTEVQAGDPLLGAVLFGSKILPEAVQWVDRDGDGRWGANDNAFLGAAALGGGQGSRVVQAGDRRLTRPEEATGIWGVVLGGDPDAGAPLQPPGHFRAFCYSDLDMNGRLGSDEGVFLTPSSSLCSGPSSLPYHLGLGIPFEAHPGSVRAPSPRDGAPPRARAYWPRESIPFAYVFSGDSTVHYPESSGWNSVRWDISFLISRQVRFAFHAWTNPSDEPCAGQRLQWFFDLPEDIECDAPLTGWTIANVAVEGERFQGKPIEIRFHLATDGSMPKGEWSLDDLLITGELYRDAVELRVNETSILAEPGAPVTLQGEVRNVGSSGRSGLALAVTGRRTDTGASVPITAVDAAGIPTLPLDSVSMGFQIVRGPFELSQAGATGSGFPFRVRLVLPAAEGVSVEVRGHLIEADPSETCDDATPDCQPRYVPIRNERGAAPGFATWTATGERRLDLRLLPALDDRAERLIANPTVAKLSRPVELLARLVNHGTTLPDELRAAWAVEYLDRKGNPQTQPGTREVVLAATDLGEQVLPRLERAQVIPLRVNFTPSAEGLYRAHLRILADGETVQEAFAEFWVGLMQPQYALDFSRSSALAGGWRDASPDVDSGEGGSPRSIRFREDGSRFIWGVSQESFFDGQNYCDFGGCNPQSTGNSGPPVYGLQGVAEGPLIDLGRVVGDLATLTIRQGHVFARGDGAVVEVLPVLSPVRARPQPAFVCATPEGDFLPAWFRLNPSPPSAFRGSIRTIPANSFLIPSSGRAGQDIYTLPERRNPLGPGPSVGGPGTDEEILRFPLGGLSGADACPEGTRLNGPPPTSLVNYTFQMRFRTGTLPGIVDENCNPRVCPDNPRTGALGWHLAAIGISSLSVDLSPDTRDLPVLDGLAKQFNAEIRNTGTVDATFRLDVETEKNSVVNASWFSFPVPEVSIAPGASVVVPFGIHVPPQPRLPRGTYVAQLVASSTADPDVRDQAQLRLSLQEQALPDLAVQLSVETESPVAEPGKELRVFATVTNIGHQASDSVELRLDVVRIHDGQPAHVSSSAVGPLCSLADCGSRESSTTRAFGWVPDRPGFYRLEAVVDPVGRLLEERLGNNRAVFLVEVVPLQRPDVVVSDLVFHGVREDGYALAGSIVTISANVTNVGVVPAADVELRVLVGTSELLEARFQALAPGETKTVTAARIASAGETTVRAIALPTPLELRSDNNELRRTLRVRSVAVSLEPDETIPTTAAGAAISTVVHVHNHGNVVERVLLKLGEQPRGWTLSAVPNPVIVAPNSKTFSILTLGSPGDAPAGRHLVVLEGVPASQSDSRASVSLPLVVAPKSAAPRITVETAKLLPGVRSLAVRLESQSNALEHFSLLMDEPEWGLSATETALAGGSTAVVMIPISIPRDAPPGPTPIRLRIFDANGAPLSQSIGVISIEPRANGTASFFGSVRLSAADLVGREFELSVRVSNRGNVPFVPEFAARDLSEGATILPLEPLPTIFPGASAEIQVQVHVRGAFTEIVRGELLVWMRPNVTQPDRGQEVDPLAVLALPNLALLPDLRFGETTVGPVPGDGRHQSVNLAFIVENAGLARSPRTDVRAYLNGDPVNAYDVPSLDVNESQYFELAWTFPEAGRYFVYFVVDGAGDVLEVYEDNNGWGSDVAVDSSPGLAAASPSAGPLAALVAFALAAVVAFGWRWRRRDGGQ